MSQCGEIWNYLEQGNTLTPLEAYVKFKTLALHSRISELRSRGVDIDMELVEFGGKRVGRYSIKSKVAYG